MRGAATCQRQSTWAKSLVNDDGTWKSDDELREVLSGVQADTPVVAYGADRPASCSPWTAWPQFLGELRRLWNEWGERPELPVVEGAEPG